MASISNIKLAATKVTGQGNTWRLTVTYDANFSQFELDNFTFRDGFEVWEQDGGLNPDDKLTGVVGVSVFNPTVTPTKRTMSYTISGSTLDTEWFGEEELYVYVRLRNLELNSLKRKRGGVLHLDP